MDGSAGEVTVVLALGWSAPSEGRPEGLPAESDGVSVLVPPAGAEGGMAEIEFEQLLVRSDTEFVVRVFNPETGNLTDLLSAARTSGRDPCTHSQRASWVGLTVRGHDGCQTAYRAGTTVLWVEDETTFVFRSEELGPDEAAVYLADWS